MIDLTAGDVNGDGHPDVVAVNTVPIGLRIQAVVVQ